MKGIVMAERKEKHVDQSAALCGEISLGEGAYVGRNVTLSGRVKAGEKAFIAGNAVVTGDVTLGDQTSVWFNAVIRGDESKAVIGNRTNVQDNATLHVSERFPLTLGDDVTVGHNAIVHGCTVGNETLVGMGAIILNGAKIGNHCLIGAGALVTEGAEIPDGSLVIGMPGKVKRELTEEEQANILKNADVYVEQAALYMEKEWA